MKRKSIFTLLVSIVMMIAALSTGQAAESGPAGITVFGQGWELYDGAEKDRVWEAVEAATNLDISLTGTPFNGYEDKMNVMINTGEIPDIFEHWPQTNEMFLRWVDEGLFLNLDEYVPKDGSKYPNLAKVIYNPQYRNLLFNGQHIMVPWMTGAAGFGIYIREDWLEKLNLSVPKTAEEFYQVMEAFTKQDPDGNGKDDTYGICGSKELFWFMPIYSAWVEKPDWNYNADKTTIEFMYATEGFKEFLAYMSKAYAQGFVVKDYYAKNDELMLEDFYTGKAGIMINNASFATTHLDKLQQINPLAKVTFAEPVSGPAGVNMHGWGGYWGGWMISAETKDPDACLRFLDYVMSEEGTVLLHYGIQDVHYTQNADGSRSITAENIAQRQKESETKPKGDDRFNIVIRDGEELPLGYYNWGQWWGPVHTFEGSRIMMYEDFSNAPHKELLELGTGIANQYCKVSDMNNVSISDPAFTEIANRVFDITKTYATKILVGELELEAGWKEMQAKLEEAGYPKVQEIAFNTLTALQ